LIGNEAEGLAATRLVRAGIDHLLSYWVFTSKRRLDDGLPLGPALHPRDADLHRADAAALASTSWNEAETPVLSGDMQRWTFSQVCADQPRHDWHFHEVEPSGCVVWAYVATDGTWEVRGSHLYTFFPYFEESKDGVGYPALPVLVEGLRSGPYRGYLP
jgi:hypothetical protein